MDLDNEIKTVYAYDTDGKYTQTLMLDHTDRNQISGAWQIPAQCTEVEPPIAKAGFNIIWAGSKWEYQEQPKEEEPIPPEPEQPTEQPYDYADPAVIALAVAVAAQEERLTALEGGAGK